MMLSKPLVSLIVAFAVATGVSAAAAPTAGDGSCNVGSVSCCTSSTTQSNPSLSSLLGLLGLPVGLNALLQLNCINIVGSTQCNTTPVCCKDVTQNGLINFGCSPLNIGL